MPLYHYKCPACEKEKEVLRLMSDSTEVICECGSGMDKQLTAPASVAFTGVQATSTMKIKGN
jgi:putative FmdB family regulatory protein